MNHTEFFDSIKNGEAARCYVLEGEEEFVKRSALEALKKKLLSGGFEAMNDSRLTDPDADALIAANETLPFMAQRRIVTVLESGLLSGKSGNYDEDKCVESLRAYLDNLPETSCLVFFVRGKADARRKLYQTLKKKAVVVSFERLSDRELTQWIAKKCKSLGKTISQDACARLFFSVGRDLTLLNGEVEKLCAYAGDGPEVTSDDIAAVCIKTVEYKVFDMANALLDGDGKRAFSLLNNILREGEDRLFLLSLLGRQCRQLLGAARLSANRQPPAAIAQQIGIPPFAVQKTLAQARRYGAETLARLTRECTNTEYLIKSGQMADEGALEKMMLTVLECRESGKNG